MKFLRIEIKWLPLALVASFNAYSWTIWPSCSGKWPWYAHFLQINFTYPNRSASPTLSLYLLHIDSSIALTMTLFPCLNSNNHPYTPAHT